tara:strand:+ start:512 stop:949 length:438 start_codon:yes stop_codon:yes gene_type:complete
MKKILVLLLILPLFTLSQNNKQPKNYISIGLFDHKSGFSALGYTRSILQNKQHELFVGFGSMIAFNTFVVGYKNYLLRSYVNGYAVASVQKIYGMPGGPNAACLSIGIEKKVWKVVFINAGMNTTCLLEDLEFLAFPTLSINMRF